MAFVRIFYPTIFVVLICSLSLANEFITKEQAIHLAKRVVLKKSSDDPFPDTDIKVSEGHSILLKNAEPVWRVDFVPKKRPCMTMTVEIAKNTGKNIGVFTSRCTPQVTYSK